MSFAYDGEYVYGHFKEVVKINMMRINAKVCFEVDGMVNMNYWRSMIYHGQFEELKDPESVGQACKNSSIVYYP